MAESYKPTEAVASNARKGLEMRERVKAGTEVGVARARDLSNRRPVSLDTIGRMVSFFARHGAQRPDDEGTEANPTPWLVAWMLWGGDAGRRWANAIWKREGRSESVEDSPFQDAAESVVLLAREAAVEGNKLEALGLDPRWWVAAVPTEFSAAGVVNKNGRIYPENVFLEAHEKLAERVAGGYISGLKGHPMQPHLQDGDREFDIAARIMSVETYTDDEGVLRSRGTIAFPNTTVGKDLYALWQGGLEIGTSSRARAMFVPHMIDESSPYYGKNPGSRGDVIMEARRWSLGEDGTYDVVLNPSASTFLDGAAREAVMRFETCIQDNATEEQMPDNKPEGAGATREEIVAQAVEAYRANDPFAAFEQEARADLLAVVKRVEGPVGAFIDALEAEKADLQAKLDEAVAAKEALESEKAAAEKAKELADALEAALEDYPLAKHVREIVGKETFEGAEALTERVDFLKGVFDGVRSQADAVSRTATESIDDKDDGDDEEAPAVENTAPAQDEDLVKILGDRV